MISGPYTRSPVGIGWATSCSAELIRGCDDKFSNFSSSTTRCCSSTTGMPQILIVADACPKLVSLSPRAEGSGFLYCWAVSQYLRTSPFALILTAQVPSGFAENRVVEFVRATSSRLNALTAPAFASDKSAHYYCRLFPIVAKRV